VRDDLRDQQAPPPHASFFENTGRTSFRIRVCVLDIVIVSAAFLPYSRAAPQPENRGCFGDTQNPRWKRRSV
jgi:hypothetical protein